MGRRALACRGTELSGVGGVEDGGEASEQQVLERRSGFFFFFFFNFDFFFSFDFDFVRCYMKSSAAQLRQSTEHKYIRFRQSTYLSATLSSVLES